ncbi:MAG TPA: alkaline phosphatase family protein [Acidimicrobiales bacterium]|nr:alkaline phosphatase family protein [Acidimicrobiales bacterium]
MGQRGWKGPMVSRRGLLAAGLAAGAGLVAGGRPAGASGLTGGQGRLLERALATRAGSGSSVGDIDHVVVLMQENRSFDHYFGTLSGVRGWSDPAVPVQRAGRYPVFGQFGYQPGVGPAASGYLQPFELVSNPPLQDGEATNDITHDWGPQHRCWNGGAMDAFVTTHLAADGADNGPLTMGYFTRGDLPFYHSLADAFTICDRYHCSVLGPTDPNRCMALSASIDPGGTGGGPVLETYVANRAQHYGTYTWETMPERLSQAGVTWKVYQDPSADLTLSPLPYFRPFAKPATAAEVAMAAQANLPQYPAGFAADVATGRLPQVSWIVPSLAQCEHPAAPPEYGENLVQAILGTLVSNPDVWATTVLFVVYDENGGFFDHVPPPVPPAGTDGEWLTVSPLPAAAAGVAGPVGLGFRVPCLVVSPFAAGGNVCSTVFDHTSVLRFLETRFGVEVPNLSAWRRRATGDMTEAFTFPLPPVLPVPALPQTSLGTTTVAEQAVLNAMAGTADVGLPYPVPSGNAMPAQETSPTRRRLPLNRPA